MMTILSRLFGAKSAADPRESIDTGPRLPEPRAMFTGSDRSYIRDALDRFTSCGLRISSLLNRDLVIARALIDAERWGYGPSREPPVVGLMADDDPIRKLFCVLADFTDSLTYYLDDMKEFVPALAEMPAEAAYATLESHSYSIFENATDVSIVNEGDNLIRTVWDFVRLTGGLVAVDDPARAAEYLDGIAPGKRVDISPVIANLSAKVSGHGQFILVDPLRSSESVIVAFIADADVKKFSELLAASEQPAPP